MADVNSKDEPNRLGSAPALKRGGPRNRSDRLSHQLKPSQCRRLIQAVEQAYHAGLPFNRYITVAFGQCGLAPELSVEATSDWITLARDWARSQSKKLAWAWVQETGPVFGAHFHALLHVPPDLDYDFRGRPWRWATKVLEQRGLPYIARTVQTQRVRAFFVRNFARPTDDAPVGVSHAACESYCAHIDGIIAKVAYMLKCAPPHLAEELGLEARSPKQWGQRCPVYGKRLGTWQFDTSVAQAMCGDVWHKSPISVSTPKSWQW